jgi:hypothetical protein
MRRVFSEYILDENLSFVPKPDTPTINFNQWKELMLSKDLSRLRELDWIDNAVDPGSRIFKQRFLDNTVNMDGNHVALCSYPRAGNSLTRSYLERVSGIATGGEAKTDLTL